MVQHFGLKNITTNTRVSGDWIIAPPSPYKMSYYIKYFGWQPGDVILSGSDLVMFVWNWELNAWTHCEAAVPEYERAFAAPDIPEGFKPWMKVRPPTEGRLKLLADAFDDAHHFSSTENVRPPRATKTVTASKKIEKKKGTKVPAKDVSETA
jgi:hypothetical protein